MTPKSSKQNSVVVYPGSFDPITLGHVNIIERISEQFDQVIILVTDAPSKKYLFSKKERIDLLQKSLRKIKNKNIKIESSADLTVNYLKSIKAKVIIRGVRTCADFEYEKTMSQVNKKLSPQIETLLIVASPETNHISSSGVKEIAKYHGNLKGFVPNHVIEPLKNKIKKRGG